MRTNKSEKYIKRLSVIVLYEMGKHELTNAQMAKKCGISLRKLEEIICAEHKGIRFETFITICENAQINYSNIFYV